MAVKVRVQNFQSIEDVTVVIDGLTVITGTNNSGKTAFMRAVRGVFTNSPAGPLVRHGCAHLTVTLTFADGTEIIWEKGWEKPGQKGKTVNRYTLNGKRLSGVGRGVPPEIESLGVREIQAASDRVWPQIADQFTGSLFLVNRPGSAIAEALSDVERVGKLSSALKASEKDRRSANDELKIRRKDVATHEKSVAVFDGLDTVAAQVRGLADTRDEITKLLLKQNVLTELRTRLQTTRDNAETLAGFDPDVIPDSARAEKLAKAVVKVTGFRDQYGHAKEEVATLAGFTSVSVPDASEVQGQQTRLEEIRNLDRKRRRLQDAVQTYSGLGDLDFPDTAKIVKIQACIDKVRTLRRRRLSANTDFTTASTEAKHNAKMLAEAEANVIQLLGDRGLCPTCNTIHEGEAHV
jgi:DNA repair exonuclease SbcCD ATPase subunit